MGAFWMPGNKTGKLVAVKDGAWELYDMEKDRTETNNLTNQFPDKVAILAKLYEQQVNLAGVVDP